MRLITDGPYAGEDLKEKANEKSIDLHKKAAQHQPQYRANFFIHNWLPSNRPYSFAQPDFSSFALSLCCVLIYHIGHCMVNASVIRAVSCMSPKLPFTGFSGLFSSKNPSPEEMHFNSPRQLKRSIRQCRLSMIAANQPVFSCSPPAAAPAGIRYLF